MKYIIYGADRETGEDRTMAVEAADETAARDAAHAQGMVISQVIAKDISSLQDESPFPATVWVVGDSTPTQTASPGENQGITGWRTSTGEVYSGLWTTEAAARAYLESPDLAGHEARPIPTARFFEAALSEEDLQWVLVDMPPGVEDPLTNEQLVKIHCCSCRDAHLFLPALVSEVDAILPGGGAAGVTGVLMLDYLLGFARDNTNEHPRVLLERIFEMVQEHCSLLGGFAQLVERHNTQAGDEGLSLRAGAIPIGKCEKCGEQDWKLDELSSDCTLAAWKCNRCESVVLLRSDPDSSADDKPVRRESIPKAVQREVWRRDQGRCVECGSSELLEFDHIIAVARGGSNTARNIQLLCQSCNRAKSSKSPGDW